MTSQPEELSLVAGWTADWRVEIDSNLISLEVENLRESWPERPLDIECFSCDAVLTADLDSVELEELDSSHSSIRTPTSRYFETIDFGIGIVTAESAELDQCHLFANECVRRDKHVTLLSISERPQQLAVALRSLQKETNLIEFRQCGSASKYEMIRRIMTAEAIRSDRRSRLPKTQRLTRNRRALTQETLPLI
jgi:hypothetical protein